MSKRIALYARVSTDMQAEGGLSIPAQLSEMKEFMAKRPGWSVAAEFVDPGFSGSTMRRPALQAMLQAVEQGNIDVVLVHELSRLSRSIFDSFRIFEDLGHYNVGFASVNDPDFDFSSPQGRFFLTMLSAMNQYYLDLLKQHTAKGKRERARQGLYNASITPYGYKHVGDAKTPPIIVETEATAVRLAFDVYATGNASYQEVADRLNEHGYQTRAGNMFGKDTVDDMLRNPFYAGLVIYGTKHKNKSPEIFPGQHEAIITREQLEACDRIRRKRRGAARSYQASFRVYLLNAISVCSICGRTLRAQATKTNRYYREMSKMRGFVDCPNAQKGVVADEVEAQIDAIFRNLKLPPDWRDEVEEMLDREAEVKTLNNRRARLEAEKERLLDLYIRGYFQDKPDKFEQRYAELEQELEMLPVGDLAAIEEAAEQLEQLAAVWDEADIETKRDLLRLALRQVEVDVQQKKVVSLSPYAAFMPLFRYAFHLLEIEPGKFIPLWPPALAEENISEERLPAYTQTPALSQNAVIFPLIMTLPRPSTNQRITPVLSRFLKARRKSNLEPGHLIEIPHAIFPRLRLDERKWMGLQLEVIKMKSDQTWRLDYPDQSVSFLFTPFRFQENDYRENLLTDAVRVLDHAGWWVLNEPMPQSMAGHWLFRYFPETWSLAQKLYLDVPPLYATIQKAGFEVQLEQQSWYQPVSYEAALAMARQRRPESLLARISDHGYQQGMARLTAEAGMDGGQGLLASHFCLAEIIAVRHRI